ncbi:MAG: hypothetical protein DKM50_04785 [Candidatus Margulisiibacteriota bacterium]|nr:MAG: hypothetical protein DKM50_04785 [Candidatus Margulisiibacteriota bacterium]
MARVLQISASYYPALKIGGPITAVHNLNKILVQKGLDLTVYTTNAHIDGPITLNNQTSVDGVNVTYFDFSTALDFMGNTGWQYSPSLKKALIENIAKYDVIHIIGLWSYPPLIALRLANKYKIPVIISAHGSLKPEHFATKHFKKSIYYNMLLKKQFKKTVFMQYFTQDEALDTQSFFKLNSKYIVIPNGINILPENEQIVNQHTGYINLLYLGRIHPVKGIEFLVAVLDGLKRININVKLKIVGTGDTEYLNSLKLLVVESDLTDRIEFLGFFDGEKKDRILKNSNVFVLPSYNEAFSMSILEAMSYKLPVIISDKCYFPEVEKNNAGVVLHHDVGLWLKAIELIVNDPEAFNKMSSDAYVFVKNNYDIHQISLKYLECFNYLASN